MALAKDTTIYRQMKGLLKLLIAERAKFPKSYRAFGQDLFQQAVRCLTLLQRANMSRETQVRYLTDFIAEFGTLGTLMEVCTELKIWPYNKAAEVALMVESIGRQATAWRNKASTQPDS